MLRNAQEMLISVDSLVSEDPPYRVFERLIDSDLLCCPLESLSHIDQTESDTGFVQRLAKQYDATATIEADNLIFSPTTAPRSGGIQTVAVSPRAVSFLPGYSGCPAGVRAGQSLNQRRSGGMCCEKPRIA